MSNAFDELKDNIKNTIQSYGQAATGFDVIDCPVCGGKKKGGIHYEDDLIIFNCFRGKCSVGKTGYSREGFLSNKFKSVLNAANVEIPLNIAIGRNAASPPELVNKTQYTEHKYEAYDIKFDAKLYNPDNPEHKKFRDYLESRHITYGLFMIYDHGKFRNRLIIPFLYNGIIIGYQAIDITGRYDPMIKGNTNMIFFPDGKVPFEPVICEGVFDALSVPNGVAVLNSTVSKQQAYILRNKKPILLPDRRGSRFVKVAKNYKWRISIPDWKAKDANETLQQSGKFVVAQLVYSGIVTPMSKAEMKYSLWNTNNKR